MIKLVLIQLTEDYAIYDYHPDGKDFHGSVKVDRLSGEIRIIKESPHYEAICKPHIYDQMDEFFTKKTYPRTYLIAFC